MRNADTAVRHPDLEGGRLLLPVHQLYGEYDRSPFGELDRVADGVNQDLPQPDGVRPDLTGERSAVLDLEAKALGLGGAPHDGLDLREDLERGRHRALHVDLPGLEPGQVEDVAQHLHQVGGVSLDRMQSLDPTAGRAREVALLDQQIGEAEDCGHGSSQLVAHVRKKLRFGPRGGSGAARGVEQVLERSLGAGDGRAQHARDRRRVLTGPVELVAQCSDLRAQLRDLF